MSVAQPRQSRRPVGLGLLLALVALAMQVAATSVMPSAGLSVSVDRLVAASICHSDAADHGGTPAPHHAPDCAVCPLCQAIAHAGALLASPMVGFAAPALFVAKNLFARPPARAPPGHTAFATSARGPPSQP
jgi:Protein of unknown function (DUF2946)